MAGNKLCFMEVSLRPPCFCMSLRACVTRQCWDRWLCVAAVSARRGDLLLNVFSYNTRLREERWPMQSGQATIYSQLGQEALYNFPSCARAVNFPIPEAFHSLHETFRALLPYYVARRPYFH